jgi:hypothetical protein
MIPNGIGRREDRGGGLPMAKRTGWKARYRRSGFEAHSSNGCFAAPVNEINQAGAKTSLNRGTKEEPRLISIHFAVKRR